VQRSPDNRNAGQNRNGACLSFEVNLGNVARQVVATAPLLVDEIGAFTWAAYGRPMADAIRDDVSVKPPNSRFPERRWSVPRSR
jgi:hypothetical protein